MMVELPTREEISDVRILDRSAAGRPVDEQGVAASHTPSVLPGGSRNARLAGLCLVGLLLGCTMPNNAYSPVTSDGGGAGGVGVGGAGGAGGGQGGAPSADTGDAASDDVRVIDVPPAVDMGGSGGGGAVALDTGQPSVDATLDDARVVVDVPPTIDGGGPGTGGAGGADAGSPVDAPRVVDAVGPGAQGLVLRWRFDETSGAVAQDSSGRGLHGTYQGTPLPAPDVQAPTGFVNPSSRRFVAASNQVVRLDGSPAALQPNTAVSLSVWFRTTATTRADLVCYGADYFIRLETGTIQFARRRPAGSSTSFLVASGAAATATDGAWHHATGLADAAGTHIWMDGKRIDSDATALPFTYTAGAAFSVGRSSAGNQPFEGLLDDVRVYNRALSDSEIKALALGAD
jgi:hypothetical protein